MNHRSLTFWAPCGCPAVLLWDEGARTVKAQVGEPTQVTFGADYNTYKHAFNNWMKAEDIEKLVVPNYEHANSVYLITEGAWLKMPTQEEMRDLATEGEKLL